ncbi:hypothetical protein JCM6882_007760 [Rhodosporidiobolus microsporus]
MASLPGAARHTVKQSTRSASTQPFFPVQSSSSLPSSLPKPPSSLWYTARPSLSATLTSLDDTLTTTRAHLHRAGLLPSLSSSIAHDAEFHAVLPHPRLRRWKPTKDMAAYLRTGTDLKSSQYKRLTATLAHLEGLLPYARVADRLAAESGSAALFDRANAAPALVTDPVSVATGRLSVDDQAVRGAANGGLEAQLEQLLARFQQQQAVSSMGVTVERVAGQDRRLGSTDAEERTMAVGRRKESGARVWIVPTSSASSSEGGEAPLGRVLINTRPVHAYFTQPTHRQAAIQPLALVDALGAFNVFALVKGGGAAAQADAVAMGVARALSEWERAEVEKGARAEGVVSWRDVLKRAELIERDPRVVERKKTGQVKARKKFTWVKR